MTDSVLATPLVYLSANDKIKVNRYTQNGLLAKDLWTFSYWLPYTVFSSTASWRKIENLVVKTEDIDKVLALLEPLVSDLWSTQLKMNSVNRELDEFQSLCDKSGITLQ